MKKFKCIGLEETKIGHWKNSFSIGKTYLEFQEDPMNGILFLISNNRKLPFHVDESQFEEIKEAK